MAGRNAANQKQNHWEGRTLPLTIEGYDSGGSGVARLPNGQVIFVPGALTGETCQVEIVKVGRAACWGQVRQVTAPSPHRLASDCPYDALCGGCQLRHMDYEEELTFKKNRVEEAIRRIGGLEIAAETIHGAASPHRYRNKVQFPVAPGPEGPNIGFYRARSHQVTDVADCLLQPTAAARLRQGVKDWMEEYTIPPYDETAHKGLIRHVYVRTNQKGEALCALVVNGETIPHQEALVHRLRQAEPKLTGLVLSVNREKTNVILGKTFRTLWGRDYLEDSLCGLTFRLSTPSFYQVNREQAEVLYRRAVEFAGLTGTETVLDLYCGIGTITLAMAKEAKRVIGAEVIPQAVADAKENARRNGIDNASFFWGDAGQVAAMLAQQGERPQVVCVDPPRKGLAPDVIETIVKMAPQRVVYVSCDPGTLARDLKLFHQQGYAPQRLACADLFPRTHHVESVVLLTQTQAGGTSSSQAAG